ncbi:MAG: hypothetical protein JEY79_01115 [Pseudodesulfovibrio sp.]|nr:hypothetical protein [Pseudodesulfovibrio sp.]
MAKYRKVSPFIWNDGKFRHLSDNSKLVFFFLLTHPHMTALGAMRANVAGLGAELGWLPKGFREAFLEATEKGMVRYDETASFVWLPKFLKHNPPESPNVVKAWAKSLELLPECDLFYSMLQHVQGYAEGLPEAFAKVLPEAFRKSMPYQEQEQEQEQDIPPKAPRRGVSLPVSAFETFWKIYPKKVAKQAALKAWGKIKGAKADEIVGALEKQIAVHHFRGNDGQEFTPNPATWLNGGRWEDEVKGQGGYQQGQPPNKMEW